jgi:hypothetical protein
MLDCFRGRIDCSAIVTNNNYLIAVTIMNKIEQIESKIEAVEIALLSFVLHRDDESNRIGYLNAKFQQNEGFLIYTNFSEEKLQEEKKQLQDRLDKLEDKEKLSEKAFMD